MGVVQRARCLRTGELVALKMLACPNETLRAALREEAAVLSHLSHPGIARLRAVGESPDGLWYARELVDGERLDTWAGLRGDADADDAPSATADAVTVAGARASRFRSAGVPMTWSVVASRLRPLPDLCETLAWLHGQGCLHLDVKPGNVIVRQDGRAILIDFGLAVHRGPGATAELLEGDPTASGTPAYMAPERFRGAAPDPRMDLYALGCVLHQMLTGRPPFTAADDERLEALHRHAVPPPVGERVAGLPGVLDELVRRLLAKTPGERPASALVVRDVLTEVLADTPHPVTRPRWPGYPPRPHLCRAPLTGRDDVLTTLLDAATRPETWVVTGGPGTGKTRLASAVITDLAARGHAVFAGRCRSDVPPLAPLLDALCASDLPEASALAGRLTAGDALPPSEVLGRLRALLRTAAAPVFVLDDVQYADSATAALLAELTARVEFPILLFGSATPTLGPPLPGRVLPLPPLAPKAVEALVAAVTAFPQPTPSILAALDRLGLNQPGHVIERLHAAIDAGVLVRDAWGRWTLPDGSTGAELPLPASLRALAETRRARWSPDACTLAEALALMGGSASGSELTAFASHRMGSPEGLSTMLGELTADGTVRFEAGAARLVDARLTAALGETLDEARRRHLHGLVARVLASGNADPGRLAPHHRASGDVTAARLAYLGAGAVAARRCAFSEALEAFAAALSLCDRAADRATALLARSQDVHAASGRWEAARDDAAEAARLLTDGPPLALALAECHAAEASRRLGRREDAESALDRAGRCLVGQRGSPAALVRSRLARTRALVLRDQGRHDEAIVAADEARQRLAAAGRAPHVEFRAAYAEALSVEAGVLMTAGRLAVAEHAYRDAVTAYRDLGDHRREAVALGDLGALLGDLGRSEEAIAASEAALELQTEGHDELSAAITMANLAMEHRHAGRLELATTLLETSRDTLAALKAERYLGPVLVNLADVLIARGRCDEALDAARDARDRMRETGGPWARYALALTARAHRRGRHDRALAAAALARAFVDLEAEDPEYALYAAERGLLALAEGDVAGAREALSRARARPAESRHVAAAVDELAAAVRSLADAAADGPAPPSRS